MLTIVEFRGEGFDPHRDANAVIIGDRPAMVVRAEPERLLAMAAEAARSSEIRVTVGVDSEVGPPFEFHPRTSFARKTRREGTMGV
ncbi:hypothetical protein AB4Z34_32170 [Ensifer sp. 2YAB10]|uniref:hypothetical protein n=1 Tax=unclassified Ensifer TaxID=2633371 RepID=UPI003F90325C